MMDLNANAIAQIAKVLEANEPYDSSWKGARVAKIVVEVGGQRVTLSRRSKYAALVVTRIDEARR